MMVGNCWQVTFCGARLLSMSTVYLLLFSTRSLSGFELSVVLVTIQHLFLTYWT